MADPPQVDIEELVRKSLSDIPLSEWREERVPGVFTERELPTAEIPPSLLDPRELEARPPEGGMREWRMRRPELFPPSPKVDLREGVSPWASPGLRVTGGAPTAPSSDPYSKEAQESFESRVLRFKGEQKARYKRSMGEGEFGPVGRALSMAKFWEEEIPKEEAARAVGFQGITGLNKLLQADVAAVRGLKTSVITGPLKAAGLAWSIIKDGIDIDSPDAAASKTMFYKWGQYLDDLYNEKVFQDPRVAESFWMSEVPESFGMLLGFMIPTTSAGKLGGTIFKASRAGRASLTPLRAARLARRGDLGQRIFSNAMMAVHGGSLQSAAGYEEAINSGASERSARLSGIWGLPVGMTEAAGVGQVLAKWDRSTGGAFKRELFKGIKKRGVLSKRAWAGGARIKPMLKGGTEEFLQEFFQSQAGSEIAENIYDAHPVEFQQSLREGSIGGLMGVLMGGISSSPAVKAKLKAAEVFEGMEWIDDVSNIYGNTPSLHMNRTTPAQIAMDWWSGDTEARARIQPLLDHARKAKEAHKSGTPISEWPSLSRSLFESAVGDELGTQPSENAVYRNAYAQWVVHLIENPPPHMLVGRDITTTPPAVPPPTAETPSVLGEEVEAAPVTGEPLPSVMKYVEELQERRRQQAAPAAKSPVEEIEEITAEKKKGTTIHPDYLKEVVSRALSFEYVSILDDAGRKKLASALRNLPSLKLADLSEEANLSKKPTSYKKLVDALSVMREQNWVLTEEGKTLPKAELLTSEEEGLLRQAEYEEGLKGSDLVRKTLTSNQKRQLGKIRKKKKKYDEWFDKAHELRPAIHTKAQLEGMRQAYPHMASREGLQKRLENDDIKRSQLKELISPQSLLEAVESRQLPVIIDALERSKTWDKSDISEITGHEGADIGDVVRSALAEARSGEAVGRVWPQAVKPPVEEIEERIPERYREDNAPNLSYDDWRDQLKTLKTRDEGFARSADYAPEPIPGIIPWVRRLAHTERVDPLSGQLEWVPDVEQMRALNQVLSVAEASRFGENGIHRLPAPVEGGTEHEFDEWDRVRQYALRLMGRERVGALKRLAKIFGLKNPVVRRGRKLWRLDREASAHRFMRLLYDYTNNGGSIIIDIVTGRPRLGEPPALPQPTPYEEVEWDVVQGWLEDVEGRSVDGSPMIPTRDEEGVVIGWESVEWKDLVNDFIGLDAVGRDILKYDGTVVDPVLNVRRTIQAIIGAIQFDMNAHPDSRHYRFDKETGVIQVAPQFSSGPVLPIFEDAIGRPVGGHPEPPEVPSEEEAPPDETPAGPLSRREPAEEVTDPPPEGEPSSEEDVRSTDMDRRLRGLPLPELVTLARELFGNTRLFDDIKDQGNRGWFNTGTGHIGINRGLAETPEELAKTLAHEIGHGVEWLAVMHRHNKRVETQRLAEAIEVVTGGMADFALPMNDPNWLPINEELVNLTFNWSPITPETRQIAAYLLADPSVRQQFETHLERMGDKEIYNQLVVQQHYWGLDPDGNTIPLSEEAQETLAGMDEKAKMELLDHFNYRFYPTELYAEALSVLLVEPQTLIENAPMFWQMFKDHARENAKFLEAWNNIHDILYQGAEGVGKSRHAAHSAGFLDAAERAIVASDSRRRGVVDAMTAMTDFTMTAFVDLYATGKRTARGYKRRGASQEEIDAVRYRLDDLHHIGGRVSAYHKEVQHRIMNPLIDAGISMDIIGDYLVQRSVINLRGDKLNPWGMDEKSAEEHMQWLRDQFVTHENKGLYGNTEANRLADEKIRLLEDTMLIWNREIVWPIVQRANESGLIGEEMWKVVSNPTNIDNYSTFQVAELLDSPNVDGAVRDQVKGTFAPIGNPFQMTNSKMISLIRWTEFNGAKRDLMFMMRQFGDEGDVVRVGTSLELRKKKKRHKPATGRGMVYIQENGTQVVWDTDKYISKMFETKGHRELNTALNFMNESVMKMFHGLYVSWNIDFGAKNPFRDIKRTWRVGWGKIGQAMQRAVHDQAIEDGFTGEEAASMSKKVGASFLGMLNNRRKAMGWGQAMQILSAGALKAGPARRWSEGDYVEEINEMQREGGIGENFADHRAMSEAIPGISLEEPSVVETDIAGRAQALFPGETRPKLTRQAKIRRAEGFLRDSRKGRSRRGRRKYSRWMMVPEANFHLQILWHRMADILHDRKFSPLRPITAPFRWFGGKVSRRVNAQEAATKLAVWQMLRKAGVSKRVSGIILRKFVGTPDYNQRGSATVVTNSIWMYSKIRTNSLVSEAEVATDPSTRAGYWFRTVVSTLIPTTWQQLATYGALGVLGEGLQAWFIKFPTYLLNNYFVIPLGWLTDDDSDEPETEMHGINELTEEELKGRRAVPIGITIPMDDSERAISMVWRGILDALVETAQMGKPDDEKVVTTAGGAQKAIDSIIGSLEKELIGTTHPLLQVTANWIAVGARGKPGYDYFRERNIVNQRELAAGGLNPHRRMMRWTIGQSGAIEATFGPIFDHWLESDREDRVDTGHQFIGNIPIARQFVRASDRGWRDHMIQAAEEVRSRRDALSHRYIPASANAMNEALSTLRRADLAVLLRREEQGSTMWVQWAQEEENMTVLQKWAEMTYGPLRKRAFNAHEEGNVELARETGDALSYVSAPLQTSPARNVPRNYLARIAYDLSDPNVISPTGGWVYDPKYRILKRHGITEDNIGELIDQESKRLYNLRGFAKSQSALRHNKPPVSFIPLGPDDPPPRKGSAARNSRKESARGIIRQKPDQAITPWNDTLKMLYWQKFYPPPSQ